MTISCLTKLYSKSLNLLEQITLSYYYAYWQYESCTLDKTLLIIRLILLRIKAHSDIECNDLADKIAKKVAINDENIILESIKVTKTYIKNGIRTDNK